MNSGYASGKPDDANALSYEWDTNCVHGAFGEHNRLRRNTISFIVVFREAMVSAKQLCTQFVPYESMVSRL